MLSVCVPAVMALFAFGGTLAAQTTRPAETAPAATQPAIQSATQPAAQAAMQGATALVADVQGHATYSVLQPDGTYGPRQPVKKGDRLAAGTKIQTRYRSFVVLTFGSDTVAKIDPLTEANVDQFLKSPEAQNVVLGLGHGMVRAGSVAPTLRSEMAIVTPTATLTKRGTFEFGLRYEAGTGRYYAYLTEEGLISVLNVRAGVRRTVEPGQYVTQAMIRWVETAVFDRWVPVEDLFGLTPNEVAFNSQLNTGRDVAWPGGGSMSDQFAGRNAPQAAGSFTQRGIVPPVIIPPRQIQGAIGRPEGNFGARR
jgi:hypothetical protein